MRTITLCFGKANRTYAVSDGLFGFGYSVSFMRTITLS